MSTLRNRARRILRRIRQLQTEIKSIDTRCALIESDPDPELSEATKAGRIAALRKGYGTMNAQLRLLVDRHHEISVVFPNVDAPARNHEIENLVWSLPETNFPAAQLLPREGKSARAWRAVQEAYAS